ncbi:MAG: selenide, water dikinase SelD [Alkalilacustris sp.]
MRSLPLTRDLVLIGGGHAHALVLRGWGMDPLPGARLTLISPAPTAPYTGMLPGHIAGHYPRRALEIDLVRLARHAGARLILDRAVGLDRAAGRIALARGPAVAYDVAALDVGITSDMPELPGFAAHAVPAKPLDAYATRWAAFLDAVAAGQAPPRVAVLGGGVAGVELALAMAHRLHGQDGARITVIEAADQPLAGLSPGARARLLGHLARLGGQIVAGARARAVDAAGVELADGRRIAAALTVGAAGARAQGWLATTGLHLTDGAVTVDRHLRSVTDPAILASGDCAHLAHAPRPKAGVFAVRAAPVLAANLRATLAEGPGRARLRPFRPQRDYLKLISTGGRGAVADKWGRGWDGGWLWWLKDRIDARFMARLSELPPMPAPPLPATVAAGVAEAYAGGQPLCAGCGAKVGGAALASALATLRPGARDDLLSGPGDDAAVLSHGSGVQVLTTDHLRALTDDPRQMARIAAVHALGDIWAMGARPQAALANITLPRMSDRLQARTLAEILQAAEEVLLAEGAALAGGHSALGDELTIGFTLTGLAPRPIAKTGVTPGAALILTKALGTGVLMAAEMARDAFGPDVAHAWDQMARPQGRAAAILAPQASAMTDITGFGLAGHLLEMLADTGLGARIDPAALPVLPGAARAAGRHASTLAAANRAAVAGRGTLPDGVAGALMVDPQTAGGLLAAVPDTAADALVAALHAAGFAAAARIGRIVADPAGLSLGADS